MTGKVHNPHTIAGPDPIDPGPLAPLTTAGPPAPSHPLALCQHPPTHCNTGEQGSACSPAASGSTVAAPPVQCIVTAGGPTRSAHVRTLSSGYPTTNTRPSHALPRRQGGGLIRQRLGRPLGPSVEHVVRVHVRGLVQIDEHRLAALVDPARRRAGRSTWRRRCRTLESGAKVANGSGACNCRLGLTQGAGHGPKRTLHATAGQTPSSQALQSCSTSQLHSAPCRTHVASRPLRALSSIQQQQQRGQDAAGGGRAGRAGSCRCRRCGCRTRGRRWAAGPARRTAARAGWTCA